ncbi:NAD(P)/FAD-dependent oxidoreductase, partial [Elusimicrobiota bacterium]
LFLSWDPFEKTKQAFKTGRLKAPEWWNADKVRDFVPQIQEGFIGGLFCHEDTQITSSRAVEAFRTGAERMGAKFIENTAVEKLIETGGKVTGVEHKGGKIEAGMVVLSAGTWSGTALEKSGVKLPVSPYRGQLLIFETPKRYVKVPVLLGNSEYYLIPKVHGYLYAGTTMEHNEYGTEPTQEVIDRIAENVTRLSPGVADLPYRGAWAGLRPGTEDDIPIMGPHPDKKGLWIVTGHCRKGILLSPWTARNMTDWMLKNKMPAGFEVFSPARFVK